MEEGEEKEVLGSKLTMEKVAAAKQYIENHYRAQMKNIQERKERYVKLINLFMPLFGCQENGYGFQIILEIKYVKSAYTC